MKKIRYVFFLILFILSFSACDLIEDNMIGFGSKETSSETNNINVSGNSDNKNKETTDITHDIEIKNKTQNIETIEESSLDETTENTFVEENEDTPKNEINESNTNDFNDYDSSKDDIDNNDNQFKNHNGKFKHQAHDILKIRQLIDDRNYDGEKIAFLTFDDGPNEYITPGILDVLKEKDVPATFFILGNLVNEDTSDILKRIYDEGHSIGTHSFTHKYGILYPNGNPDPDVILDEETLALNAIRKYLGKDFFSRIFRYPGGHMSLNYDSLKVSDDLLSEYDIHWIDWNTMTGDAQPVDAQQVPRPMTIQNILDNFDESTQYTPNSDIAVILMHDSAEKELTLEALPSLIDHLKEKGYSFGILE